MKLKGHTGTVYGIAYSSDGRTLVSGSGDNTLRLWDVSTGQETVAPVKHRGDVLDVSCSPTEPIAVTASLDKLHLIDLTTGEILGRVDHHHNVHRVEFSPDGRYLAAGGNDKRIYFYDAKSQKLLGSGDWQAGPIAAIAYNPTGSMVAVGSGDRFLKVYDTLTRESIVETRTEARISDMAFSADGSCLMSCDLDGAVYNWDPSTLDRTDVTSGGRRLRATATSPADSIVAIAGLADDVEVWDYRVGRRLGGVSGFAGETLALAFNPTGSSLAAGGTDDIVTTISIS